MSVKYNKARDRFEIRHYEDLSNSEIVEGVNNFDKIEKDLIALKNKQKKIEFEARKIKAEIEDLENYQDVIERVTHIFNGVPVMQSISTPTEESPRYGRFNFSGIGSYNNRKMVEAWTNSHLSDEQRLTEEYIWCFKIQEGNGVENTFLPNQYSENPSDNGFSLNFIKLIAYEFVVNDRPATDFYRNLSQWFKMYDRDKAIKDLLD